MKDLISVIIPVYNVEKYLRRCLDSVRNQSYKNLQIVLVNDGSTDGSGEICDEYAKLDERFVVCHKVNEGVAKARNTALSMARGEFVGFADADDYLEQEIFAKLHEALISNEADLAVCGYYEEYADRCIEIGTGNGMIVYDNYDAYVDYFKMGGRIGSGCWNKLFRAKALNGIEYKPYVMGEDVEMLSRALNNCNKVVCIDYAGYHYIHRMGSATQLSFRKENLNIIDVMDEVIEFVKENHPDLINNVYAFQASWIVAILQCLYGDRRPVDRKFGANAVRKAVKENIQYYRGNKAMYLVDRVLLEAYL